MPSSCARPPDAFLRLVFAGTPQFAERALAALVDAGHEIVLVLTQPDRPGGRGLRPAPSAVKRLAESRGFALFQPASLNDAADRARILAAGADAMVVAAYGLLLPKALLDIGRFGALNIHASLLPRWRGAAPIQRALLAGDAETGVSIMRMDEGLDTGPVLARRAVPIAPQDNAATLHDKLAGIGAELMCAVLDELAAERATAVPQPEAGVTYAPKIAKGETRLDWRRPAEDLERAVRAFYPATTFLSGEPIRVWRAELAEPPPGEPGTLAVRDGALLVACGSGGLALHELQRAGGRRMAAAEFLRGRVLAPGARLA